MTKLIIVSGVSGSGKSTWAESQPNVLVVSRDAIRVMLYGGDGPDYYQHPQLKRREDFVTKVERSIITNALNFGTDVISDNTNIEPRFYNKIAQIGYAIPGVEVERKVFDVALKTVLERNTVRALMGGRFVPEDVIRKQHDRFQHTKNLPLEKAFAVTPYNGTPGKPEAFLFDLDGTTFHMGNKRHFAGLNVDVDDPDEVILDIVRRLQDSGLIAIAMSGRVEATRELSLHALMDNLVYPHELFMRADGDNRKDNIIKAELFDNHVRDNYDVKFVLDDRNQVVDMWRAMGIKCLQVAEGNF